jgi:PAS domain S-box-containing protein
MGKSHGPEKPKNKDIRRRAENLLLKPSREPFPGNIHLPHELRFYQAELEVQNKELRNAQSRLEESLKKYSDLYDFSPVAYFTIDEDSTIKEVNLRGASLLRADRRGLLKRSFRSFVHPEDHRIFFTHLQNTMATSITIGQELRLVLKDGTEKWVSLDSVAHEGPKAAILGIRTAVTDITERKKSEKALLENQKDMNRAQTLARTGSWRLDVRRDEIFWTDETYRIFGIPRGTSLTYETFLSAVHPDDRRYVDWKWKAALRGEPYDIEHRIVAADEVKWVRERAELEFDDEGMLLGGFGSVQDITERKRAEQALQESEQKLRLFIEHAPAAIAMFDRDMRYLAASRRWLIDYSLGDQDILGRSHYEVFPEMPERWKKIHRRCLAGATEKCEEDPFHRSDGRVDWVRWEVLPWYGYDGYVGGLIMFTEVITERKEAEDAVKESEERYRITLEGMMDAVCIQTVEDGRYLYANKAFCDLTGYRPEEVFGKTPFELNLLPAPAGRDDYIGSIMKKAGSGRLEIPYRMKDSTILDTLLSCTPVKYMGEDCAVVVMTDVTALKRSEEEKRRLEIQLAQSQKMEALGTLAGGIAHDFNNVLTAIMGYTEIALLNVPVPEKVKKNLNDVLKSSKRARDLVSQILSFSRHAAGEFAPITLGYPVQESLTMLRSMIPMNIEIRQNLISSGKVMADPSQINQMMMNLSINAAQAMGEEGGVMEVRLDGTSVDRSTGRVLDLEPGPYLRITISDTGCGMTPEIMPRIFDPYFTTKKGTGSTGLGLSIVHGIVKRHGGAITCRSAQGRGATFEIYLPETEAEEAAAEPPVEMKIPTGTERILFIDDEPDLVNVGRNLLEALGYQVTVKTSSVEALELFKSDPGRFDLVVTDMTMPEMMGDKLAQGMMKIRPDIPVILYTGFSEYITEERVKSIGIREFFLKPFEMKDMAQAIRKVLDKK